MGVSCALHRLHAFPSLAPVAWFPPLDTDCFSNTLSHLYRNTHGWLRNSIRQPATQTTNKNSEGQEQKRSDRPNPAKEKNKTKKGTDTIITQELESFTEVTELEIFRSILMYSPEPSGVVNGVCKVHTGNKCKHKPSMRKRQIFISRLASRLCLCTQLRLQLGCHVVSTSGFRSEGQ